MADVIYPLLFIGLVAAALAAGWASRTGEIRELLAEVDRERQRADREQQRADRAVDMVSTLRGGQEIADETWAYRNREEKIREHQRTIALGDEFYAEEVGEFPTPALIEEADEDQA